MEKANEITKTYDLTTCADRVQSHDGLHAVKEFFQTLVFILMEVYKQVRSRTNAMNSKLTKEYFTDKIHSCEGNMKDSWSTINMLICKRPKTIMISSLLVDGNETKPKKIAASMKKYF